MPNPAPRATLTRLRDERRLLHTLTRMIVDDVREARALGAAELELAHALDLPLEYLGGELEAELAALQRWAT